MSAEKRIDLLKQLNKAEIKTVVFISPIFPEVTDWRKVIQKTKNFINGYWFENLNLYFTIQNNVYNFLKKNSPKLIDKYKEIYSGGSNYWDNQEKKIKEFCNKNNLNCNIYFHH